MKKPTFDEENQLWDKGYQYIAGVDEVGRGCFAGPVVAAAVILPPGFSATDDINDSKVLTAKKREQLSEIIKRHALRYAIAEVPVWHINIYGIGKSGQLAFSKAVASAMNVKEHTTNYMLHTTKSFILVDGFPIKSINKKYQKAIVKGDSKSISIAAASIIAKVYRDELMQQLPKKYIHYGFAVNKGYGTQLHRDAIKQFGLCDMHRTSFNLEKFV